MSVFNALVEGIDGFETALARVRESRPDVMVVSLTPAHLPWHELQHACASQSPPVPVLYESCVAAGAEELGLVPLEGRAEFLPKPAPSSVLGAVLRRLLSENGRSQAAPLPA